ncbi:pentatricopeptide repeat-containing protein At4g16390, chloroplastic [Rhododendron vialii]|uniref:pentatricopeptide repeat-containing protein At4g16390, chloroplastic n=1 Tax=Rhododendron vialii TaxID=182163 RepID=UPI00265E45F7|nr:pentatricopeptide repeat-containing protein At4g16390, chloroplastic [Rhododendron vialii]XP_058196829.1 pentatricopeptide repeat-containing protein At4g16390, chloroplastic [Rhododendron vialii]XP_058196831.1 pentatricopeptide repeat-containing protein At4g16390, chloroplastic [Rhododendron vialii]
MASRLCSCSCSLTPDHHFFIKSLSTPPLLKPTPFPRTPSLQHFNFPLSPHRRTSLQIAPVSVQDPVLRQTHEPDSEKPKSYVWVNPKSPRAAQLREQSYDARYAYLVSIAESLNSCNPDEKDVYSVLDALDDKIVEQDAVVVLNSMSNPETAPFVLKYFQERIKTIREEVILYNVTFKVFRKCKDLDRAEKLFGEMVRRGVKPDNITFSAIISCARRSSLPEKAVEWYEKMPAHGCQPDDIHHAVIIDAYGQTGNIDMALSLYDRARAKRWRLDALTFATLIKIYGMSGNFEGCLNVYEEMKAIRVKPNLTVYNSLLDAMGRAKRPWQAKSIYEEMIINGFKPSWATHAALLRAFSKVRHADDGLRVYREMKRKGMELNVTLYNTVLAMFADVGYVDEAVEVFEDMKRSGTCKPDSRTFSSLMTAYSCSGKVSEAEALFDEMLAAGFEPSIFILTSLVQCYGKAKSTDDVVRTFNWILVLDLTPDERFCCCLLNVVAHTPAEELGKIISCLEKANAKLGYVVKLLVDGGNGEEQILMRETHELLNSVGPDIRRPYCNSLIEICVNLNMLERACELFDLGLRLELYANVQSKSPVLWSLNLKSLSLGAAVTALHVWMNDLSKALESEEELPSLLGISTGHGKHRYPDSSLAEVLESRLKELNAPFHESPDKVGWFTTTKVAAKSWLESRRSR